MAEALPKEGIDFRYLILEYYKKLGLTEQELCVLLMINHLLNQQNDWITPDMLSVKMNLKTGEADKIMAELLGKNYIEYTQVKEGANSKWRTSLRPLNDILWQHFSRDMAKSNQNRFCAERADTLSDLYGYFEKKLSKSLSPFDKDLMNSWLDDGYRKEQIEAALEDSLLEGKKTMKSIGKRLKMQRAGEDIQSEGYTAISDSWDRDIQKTIDIINTKWVDDGSSN